jgi:hypothetical protein
MVWPFNFLASKLGNDNKWARLNASNVGFLELKLELEILKYDQVGLLPTHWFLEWSFDLRVVAHITLVLVTHD